MYPAIHLTHEQESVLSHRVFFLFNFTSVAVRHFLRRIADVVGFGWDRVFP